MVNFNDMTLEKHKKTIEEVRLMDIDLDAYVKTILVSFAPSTKKFASGFDKVARKKKMPERLDFVKTNVLPVWISEVESSDEDEILSETRLTLDDESFLTYLAFIFISVHSKNISGKIGEFLTCIVAEMILKALRIAAVEHSKTV